MQPGNCSSLMAIGNRRIAVFDMKTGAYKRHWGAYGTKQPSDDKLPAYTPVSLSDFDTPRGR